MFGSVKIKSEWQSFPWNTQSDLGFSKNDKLSITNGIIIHNLNDWVFYWEAKTPHSFPSQNHSSKPDTTYMYINTKLNIQWVSDLYTQEYQLHYEYPLRRAQSEGQLMSHELQASHDTAIPTVKRETFY